ncbi:hypothetical protein [Actinocatenispora thailandica]
MYRLWPEPDTTPLTDEQLLDCYLPPTGTTRASGSTSSPARTAR